MYRKKMVVTAFVLLFAAAAWCQDTKATPSLNHIAQYVVNLKVSTDFYQNIIGLDTIPEPFHDGKHTWFAIGPKSHLHVISGAQDKVPHDKNSHLCFTVPSVLDFIAKLKKQCCL